MKILLTGVPLLPGKHPVVSVKWTRITIHPYSVPLVVGRLSSDYTALSLLLSQGAKGLMNSERDVSTPCRNQRVTDTFPFLLPPQGDAADRVCSGGLSPEGW